MSASTPDKKTARGWSLRNRLLLLLLLATSGMWLLGAWSMYQDAKWQSQELFDDSLQETAYLLLTMVQHEMAEHGVTYAGQLVDAAAVPGTRTLRFQIWDSQNRLVYRSPEAPQAPLVARDASGYGVVRQGAESLRTFAAWNKDRSLQIQMADTVSHRDDAVRDMLGDLLAFMAVFLPLTLWLMWWIVSRSFAPIEWISENVAARTARQLEDVDLRAVPREISPLIRAINTLLGRVRDTLVHERRFTADAAHELRTPLAAVRAHAQVLQGARTPEEAQEAVQDIVIGVDRSRRLVDQLMALAHVDQGSSAATPAQNVDLGSLVQQQVSEHADLARRHAVQLVTEVSDAQVRGYVEHLQILLRNLIDNALRYTPAGGTVRVSCGMTDSGAMLAVHDNGFGIPLSERKRVFERFYRINRVETGHVFGSGLGLSIVQRLAEYLGARVELEDGLDGRGVGFVVRFAADAEPTAAAP